MLAKKAFATTASMMTMPPIARKIAQAAQVALGGGGDARHAEEHRRGAAERQHGELDAVAQVQHLLEQGSEQQAHEQA